VSEQHPVFTQKHYEHLTRELRRERASAETIETLCRIFERDNPKFKRDFFQTTTRPQEGHTT
jgi:hypothetical protein